jgi:hypothetical protein
MITADLVVEADTERVVKETIAKYGQLDILVSRGRAYILISVNSAFCIERVTIICMKENYVVSVEMTSQFFFLLLKILSKKDNLVRCSTESPLDLPVRNENDNFRC